jgi:hypothetical protein
MTDVLGEPLVLLVPALVVEGVPLVLPVALLRMLGLARADFAPMDH